MLTQKILQNDSHTKFLQTRVVTSERKIAEVCHAVIDYSKKANSLHNKSNELALCLDSFAEVEEIHPLLHDAVSKLADTVSADATWGNKRVNYLDTKVIKPLAEYEHFSKKIKDELKHIYIVKDKEISKKRQLDRIKERSNQNRHQIIQAETEFVQASTDVTRTINSLENQITTFERQKLHDLKNILLDFVATELAYHAKALELFTQAYRKVQQIDSDDIENFKKTMKLSSSASSTAVSTPEKTSNDLGHRMFRKTQSLSNIFSPLKSHSSDKKFTQSNASLINPEADRTNKNEKGDDDDINSISESTSDDEISNNSVQQPGRFNISKYIQ